MHDIIQTQEGLIKQFQNDIVRQEGIITRYEKHIRQLEVKTSSHQFDNEVSGFTDRESSSFKNPSSQYNLGFGRQGTDLMPTTQILSPCETELEADGTVKYNLTEKSSSHRHSKRAITAKSHKVGSPIKKPTTVLSDSKLNLMEEKEGMRLRLRKKEKQEKLLKQKINKLMFFFFTLQNKGVPVNEIYEQEGIKAIKTDRFDEIMIQIAKENGDNPPEKKEEQSDQEFSFFTEDSYEYL